MLEERDTKRNRVTCICCETFVDFINKRSRKYTNIIHAFLTIEMLCKIRHGVMASIHYCQAGIQMIADALLSTTFNTIHAHKTVWCSEQASGLTCEVHLPDGEIY